MNPAVSVQSFDLPVLPEVLPTSPGVYAIYLRIASRYHAGIQGFREPSASELVGARQRLIARITNFSREIESFTTVSGTLSSQSASRFLKRVARAEVREELYMELPEILQGVEDSELIGFIDALDEMSSLMRPLYVGQTTKQTLRDRYRQHRDDYERGRGAASFGSRARSARLLFSDLRLVCYATPSRTNSSSFERSLERAMHSIAHPFLSAR